MKSEQDKSTFSQALGLIDSPEFAALRRRAADAPLSWDDFKLMRMPGTTPEQTWLLLNTLRRQTGITVPYTDDTGRTGWYTITKSMMADCNVIDRHCSSSSWLDSTLKLRNPLYSLLEETVRELITVLALDGLEVSYETSRSFLLGNHEPETQLERLLVNIRGLLYDLPALSENNLDIRFIAELARRITRDVDLSPTPVSSLSSPAWKQSSHSSPDSLKLICEMANGAGVDPSQHALIVAFGIDSLFAESRPFHAFNNLVSWLFLRAYLQKKELPVLAQMPIHDIRVRWQHGFLEPPSFPHDSYQALLLVGDSVDFTVHLAGSLELVKLKVLETEKTLYEQESREESLNKVLEADREINHRQRFILQQSLRDPTSVFRIATHEKSFRVVYATARKDLYALEQMGFLERSQVGSAFVFKPINDLAQSIAKRWPEANIVLRKGLSQA